MAVEQAEGVGDHAVVAAAQEVQAAADGQPYTWGGHTTDGFDCSGFVIYVLRQAYPDAGYEFETARQIYTDRRFERVATPQPGDLICFPSGPGKPYDHIGIVYDAGHWVGSQTSVGVQYVSFGNVYWSRQAHFFLRRRP